MNESRKNRGRSDPLEKLRAFFQNPQRQAFLWALVGIIGVGLLAIGIYLTQSAGDSAPASGQPAARPRSPSLSPTVAASPSPSASPTETASPEESPSPSSSPSPSPTPRQQNQQGGSIAATATSTPEPPPPTATPIPPTPTPVPVVAGGGYCSPAGGIPTPAKVQRIAGRLTIGGQPAVAGQAVSVSFDGVAGVSASSVDGGGYGVTYDIGGPNCANRPGASIAVVFKGVSYPTGLAVPPENNASFQQYDIAAP